MKFYHRNDTCDKPSDDSTLVIGNGWIELLMEYVSSPRLLRRMASSARA